MEKTYCIIAEGERVRARLAEEGIDSICMYLDDWIETADIEKLASMQVVIIMGGPARTVKRVGEKLTYARVYVRCYKDNVRKCDVLSEPLSSRIDSEDAEKIERVAKSFKLKPFKIEY